MTRLNVQGRTAAEAPKSYDPLMTPVSQVLARFSSEVDDDLEWVSSEALKTQSSRSGPVLRPLQVTWEMTRSADPKRTPPRGGAHLSWARQQPSTAEAFCLIEQIAGMRVPLLALTGGDPLLRPDLLPILEFAARRSVRTSLALRPSRKLDSTVIADLKACGLVRVAFWLHASTPAMNDRLSGLHGSYRRTLELIGSCHEVQLPVQINTTLSRRNVHEIETMIELLTRLDIALWNVFFVVPTGEESEEQMLNAEEHEQVFARLYAASKNVHFQIKTTEGQHYQRYVAERRARESRGALSLPDALSRPPKGVNDGKASIFISYTGDVYPSRYLPLSAGNVMERPLSEIYCDSPLLQSLRDTSRLKGKCGRCPARTYCGGSRARAYAMTGDLFAPDPCCAYEP